MSSKSTYAVVLLLMLLFFSCQPKEQTQVSSAPLASWNDLTSKKAIVAYVEEVTAPESEHFIPVEDRIATFDNDGTLWSEQPMYFQLFFILDRVKAEAADHPEWQTEEPFASILKGDVAGALSQGDAALIKLATSVDTGISTEEFYALVNTWIQNSNHPRFDKPFNELIYQPMLELIDYLKANDFTVFIVSGGGLDFMRPWAPAAYGIPTHQIVGTRLKSSFSEENESFNVIREAEVDFIDDKEGKPVGIMTHIGKRPVFVAGNSDGDLQMMQFTDGNSYKSFQLYVHHTDAEREWAYDRESSIGHLDKGLDYGKAKGWTFVDMKNDWKVVYPFEMNKNE